jgi:membrane-associated protein
LFDFLLHFDKHLLEFISTYGSWVYGVLFGIILAETGFVVTPFLPGDSLLFAAGAVSATGALNAPFSFVLLAMAAFLGDAINFTVGRSVGPRIFSATRHSGIVDKLLNRDHLARAHTFFEQYGGKAVVLARFVPIVRTFLPFVAGAAGMSRPAFTLYNLVGAVGWVGSCLGAGLLFGNIPIVKENFPLVTVGIVFVSVLPMVFEYLSHRRRTRTRTPPPRV